MQCLPCLIQFSGPWQPKETEPRSKLSILLLVPTRWFWGACRSHRVLPLTWRLSYASVKGIPDLAHIPKERLCQSPSAQPGPAGQEADKSIEPTSRAAPTPSYQSNSLVPLSGLPLIGIREKSSFPRWSRCHFKGSGSLCNSSMTNLTGPPWLYQASRGRPGQGSEVRGKLWCAHSSFFPTDI